MIATLARRSKLENAAAVAHVLLDYHDNLTTRVLKGTASDDEVDEWLDSHTLLEMAIQEVHELANTQDN